MQQDRRLFQKGEGVRKDDQSAEVNNRVHAHQLTEAAFQRQTATRVQIQTTGTEEVGSRGTASLHLELCTYHRAYPHHQAYGILHKGYALS